MKRFAPLLCSLFFASLAFAEKIAIPISGLETSGDGIIKMDFEWSDDWFFTRKPSEYNHDLARLACALAENAYSDVLREYPDSSLSRSYEALGVQKKDIEYHYDVDYSIPVLGNNQAAFSFASRKLESAGQQKTLVFVVIRGTPLNANEWISNIDISDSDPKADKIHEGFYHTAEQIHGSLIYFLLKHSIDPDNCCFLITGHSRGAAAANLLGAMLFDEGVFKKDCIYDYTFAAPNVASLEGKTKSNYNFIWNIVNAEDIVPAVPPRRGNWNYEKFGQTLVTANYWSVPAETYENKFLGRDFSPFRLGPFLPSLLARMLSSSLKNVADYYTSSIKIREKLENVFYKIFPNKKPVEEEVPEEEKKTTLVGHLQNMVNKHMNGFIDTASISFVDMHSCEGYLSWLLAFDENELFSEVGSSQIIIEKSYECAVFNSDGEVVARMLDGILQFKSVKKPIGAAPLFGKTVIAFPSNADFTVVVYKNSLIPTIIPVTIEHFDSEGYLVEQCEKKSLNPSRFFAYRFKAGKVTMEQTQIVPEKITGTEILKVVKEGGLRQQQHFRFQPEFGFNPMVGVIGGFHWGCRNIFATFLIGKAIASFDDGFFIAPGIGHEANLYGHIMLDVEFLSKIVWTKANKENSDSPADFVPALRFSFMVKPYRRVEFFTAVTLDAHIDGFNDNAFGSDVRNELMPAIQFNDDFEIVPSLSFGIKF